MVAEKTCRIPLLILTFLIASSNVIFIYLTKTSISMKNQVTLQIVTDLILLTLLLHYSGGCENPFFFIYIFHVILSGIVLPRKDAYKVTLLICLLFGGLIFLELLHILPHCTPLIFPHHIEKGGVVEHAAHNFRYVGITYLVFVLVMFVACYFTSLLTERIRGQIQKECSLALQLAQATKLSAIGEFAGYIMHEINNPLGIIEMRVKMLLSELTDNSQLKIKNDLEIVSKQVSRIAYLTKELLNYCSPSYKKKRRCKYQRGYYGNHKFYTWQRLH